MTHQTQTNGSFVVCCILNAFVSSADYFQNELFQKNLSGHYQSVTPWAGPFLSQGHNLNKLGRGLQGDLTNQISRLYDRCFQTSSFFMQIFPI